MGEKFEILQARLTDLASLGQAIAVLDWDHQVNMPPGGVQARAAQVSLLARLQHEMATSDEMGRLLEAAESEMAGIDYDSDAAGLLRAARFDYDQETRFPTAFVEQMSRLTTEAHEIWAKARANKDFASFAPTLEKLMELARQGAEYLGYEDHPYDALLNRYERGMTAARVKEIFDGHKPQLVELIAAIGEVEGRVSDALLHQNFEVDRQREFSLWAAKAIGYDFARGRLDVAVHPFCTSFTRGDVRMTTRYYDDFFNPAFFGVLHEAGHGLYEQGIGEGIASTILGSGTSLGVHESQSRMWENIVGRSREFWQFALPKAQELFPAQFGNASVEDIFKAANRVERQFIRVEADEATYNLHIMLRFEIEVGLLEGSIRVADLPQVWNARFEEYLGLTPPDDAEGVLQDVHWSAGLIGYFPTYALGNLLSVQYFNKALEQHPNLRAEFAQGKFDTLLNWLITNIHQHGRKFTSEELTQRITGTGIDSAPYIRYLQGKFKDVYGL